MGETIHFEEFAVDLRAGEVRKQGRKIKLQDKPFQILSLLLQNPGEVVTRDELRAKVWPAGIFVDFDHGLKTAVSKIRIALGDSAERPRFVETLPRRGYRFIGRLGARDQASRRSPKPDRIMLAVLPFEDYSAAGDGAYFADGMTEEAIARLGGLCPEQLGVIARTSVVKYKNAAASAAEIGRELKVDYLVEGSVRCAQGRVRITVQLVHASNQTHLWAESYEGDLEDTLALQSRVARAVAREIARKLALEGFPELTEAPLDFRLLRKEPVKISYGA